MNKIRNLKLFSLVCILAFALVFIGFHFLQAQGNSKKDKPPGKPKPPPPELSLDYGDIITTEENALRVWKVNNDISQWSTKTPGYNSVAVGDVDDDGYREIVVPEIKEIKKKGGCAPCAGPFKIFLNVYKEGCSGIWESTEEYGEGLGYVEDPASFAEVVIDNVDQERPDEVILRTANYLAIFKYTDGMLKIVSKIDVSALGLQPKAIFYAVTTGNIPIECGGYAGKEIIVFVQEWTEGFDEGWIYILDKDLKNPLKIIDISDIRVSASLRVADLDGDSYPEICLAGSLGSVDTGWQPYVFVWDFDGNPWNLSEVPIPGWDTQQPNNLYPYVSLDVGDLDNDPDNGKEIVVYSNLPDTSDYYQLIIYKYNNGIYMHSLPVQVQARIYSVEIGDVVKDGYEGNEIIAAGRAKLGTQSVFYLGAFDSNLRPLWDRIGEHPKEGMVFDTAIVK